MAGSKEPGGSGPIAASGADESERVVARDKASPRATTGRIPSLTPLKPLGAAAAPAPEVPAAEGSARPAFKGNITAFWTPPSRSLGQGSNNNSSSGFVRIATPVTTLPGGVMSIVSSSSPSSKGTGAPDKAAPRAVDGASRPGVPSSMSGSVVSISVLGGAPSGPMFAETPPFGISSQPLPVGVPTRAPVARSGRIPFRVGEYEVATRIAQGGSGSIYVCRRSNGPQPQSLLTLKVIRQHALAKEAAIFAFKREARVGELVRHANAHTVVHIGTYDGQPFLILPYVEGGDLGSLMTDDNRPPPAVVVTVLLDVLRALQHAHRAVDEGGNPLGLVHGDVSPENILIGTDGVARLTDFGSTRFTAESKVGPVEDTFGFRKPAYVSPEQLRGEPFDARADIFAVGVVMWTALTGQKLFVADTYDQTVMRVMRRKVPPPSSLGGPAILDEVCLQALRRTPEGRFASASEMVDALMAVAVKADLVATRERVGQWVRRAMGEQLAERRRRIELMFGGEDVKAVSPTAPASSGAPENKAPLAATIQMNAVQAASVRKAVAAELGAVKNVPMPTMIIDTEKTPGAQLSRRQWYVVVSVAVATFLITLAVGSWVSRLRTPYHRPRPAVVGTAAPPAQAPGPATADLPANSAAH